MKIAHILPSIALSSLLFAAPAFAADSIYPDHPASAGMVNDFAHVLSPSQQASLEGELRKLEHDTKAEVAVVTVPSLHDIPIEEYSIQLARRWGVSDAGVGNGVLFLIAPNDHHERIEVGTRLEPYLTDAVSKQILLEHYHPHFAPQYGLHDVPGAIVDTTHAIDQTLRQALTPTENKAILSHEKKAGSEVLGAVLFWVTLAGVLALIAFAVYVLFLRNRYESEDDSYDHVDLDDHHSTIAPTGTYSPSYAARPASPPAPPARESDDSLGTGLAAGAVLGAMSRPRGDDKEESRSRSSRDDDDTSGGFSFGDSGSSDNSSDFSGGGASGDD